MINYSFYQNLNGKESFDHGTFPSTELNFSNVMEDLFRGDDLLFTKALLETPPRMNKKVCSGTFPPSNVFVRKDTKEMVIEVAATGLTEDEIFAELDDGKILLTFTPSENEDGERLYTQKSLKLVSKETKIAFEFDTKLYNPESIATSLKNGLLTITLSPRDELKPVKKILFGTKGAKEEVLTEETSSEETSSEEKTE